MKWIIFGYTKHGSIVFRAATNSGRGLGAGGGWRWSSQREDAYEFSKKPIVLRNKLRKQKNMKLVSIDKLNLNYP